MNFLIGLLAFVSEYLDSGLGMGYGTALAPLLVILGYTPLSVVPAILVSQFATDISACIFHHRQANVNLRIDSDDFKAAVVLGAMGVLGVVLSVIVAIKISKTWLTLYMGLLVLSMGILILATLGKTIRFSWGKIMGISFVAAFNKGISGGGYGPLLMGGQILSGVNAKNAVGITAFAEALTCLVGFIFYAWMGKALDWRLIALLLLGAIPAVPLAALTVKNIHARGLKKYVGLLLLLLGLLTLLK